MVEVKVPIHINVRSPKVTLETSVGHSMSYYQPSTRKKLSYCFESLKILSCKVSQISKRSSIGNLIYRRCHEKTSYVSNYVFFTLLHKWVDRGQMHHFEELQ